MGITNDQLLTWTKPWFNNQEEMATTASNLVKEAVKNHKVLEGLDIRVFAKGSYANNTNIKRDSDIDIAVEYKEMIRWGSEVGTTFSDTGMTPYSGISENDFKQYLGEALVTEFGNYMVNQSGNKIFKIRGSDKILNADVIPCTIYNHYYAPNPNSYHRGIQLILNILDGKKYFNFPDQHYEHGKNKNLDSKKRFKSVVRILKNINNNMLKSEEKPKYHSFMIECLAYNIRTSIYLTSDPWREVLKNVCIEAWAYLKVDEPVDIELRWVEVNNIKFLFYDKEQKWTREDAKNFILDIYKLL